MTASTELNEAFNPATEEGSPELTLLPKGAYLAEIEDAIIKPYKSGRGQAVNLTWSIMDEKYGGRRVWQRCTLSHESEQAMKIGRQQFKDNLADRLSASSADLVYAVVDDHNQLLAAIRRRIEELDVSHETVEHLAGLQSGYLSKVIADPPPKRMSPFTQFLILQALGLRVKLEEDQQLIEKLRSRWSKRKLRKSMRTAVSMDRVIYLPPDFMRRISRMGCEARMQKLTAVRRSELARNAAKARWSKKDEAGPPIAKPEPYRQARARLD
jgi:hypothetical protein